MLEALRAMKVGSGSCFDVESGKEGRVEILWTALHEDSARNNFRDGMVFVNLNFRARSRRFSPVTPVTFLSLIPYATSQRILATVNQTNQISKNRPEYGREV
jgi:hypothetical protein